MQGSNEAARCPRISRAGLLEVKAVPSGRALRKGGSATGYRGGVNRPSVVAATCLEEALITANTFEHLSKEALQRIQQSRKALIR